MKANRFMLDEEGEISPGYAIGIAIAVVVMAAVLPSALDTFYAADTANWTIDGAEDTRTTNLWYLIPLLVIVAFLMRVYSG